MIERDPKIVQSDLSRTVKQDGVTVEVSIIRLVHETEWSLEVVNSAIYAATVPLRRARPESTIAAAADRRRAARSWAASRCGRQKRRPSAAAQSRSASLPMGHQPQPMLRRPPICEGAASGTEGSAPA